MQNMMGAIIVANITGVTPNIQVNPPSRIKLTEFNTPKIKLYITTLNIKRQLDQVKKGYAKLCAANLKL